jgi:glycosyltransferase involved in cell wall biosynthesis
MRLLILDQFSDPGGAQQMLLELLPALRQRGWEAIVGLPGCGALCEQVRAEDFAVAPITCGPYRSGRKSFCDVARFLAGVPRLAREIRSLAHGFAPDLIYVNGPRLLPGVALAGVRTPVLFHAHSYVPAGLSRWVVGRSLRRLGAWVAANCRFVGGLWIAQVGGDKIRVIYNGVGGSPFGGETEPRLSAKIGCVGRIAPEKGQKEFLAAASLIHRALPECRFAIYGSALFSEPAAVRYEREVRAAAARLPVEFAGWVSDPHQALATLDLLLVPSVGNEATTRVILEAFAAGVPVIAFPSGGIPEILEDGRTGFLCNDPAEMAHRAIELLRDAPHRLDLVRQNARETWRRRFTAERWRGELLSWMEHCCGRPLQDRTELPPQEPIAQHHPIP